MSLALRIIKHNKKIFSSHYDMEILESIIWATREANGKVSIAGIAKHHGVSERTVKRRISFFKNLGFIQVDSVRNRVNVYKVTPDSEIDYRFLPDEAIGRIEKSYKNSQQVTPVTPCKNTKNKQESNPIYNKQVIGDYSQYFAGPGTYWDYQESDFYSDQSSDDDHSQPEPETPQSEATESPTVPVDKHQALSDCLLTEDGINAGFSEKHVIQLLGWRFKDCSLKYLTLTTRYFLQDLSHPLSQFNDPVRYLFRVLGNRSVYASQSEKWEAEEDARLRKIQREKELEAYYKAQREESERRHQEYMKIPEEVRIREAKEHEERQQSVISECLRIAKRAAGAA
jgi:hypothetical protein